jgi:trigger factor
MAFLKEKIKLEQKVKLTVAADCWEKKYHSKLQELAKTAQIQGFRKGKVPAFHIESLYGKGVQEEVIRNEVIASYQKHIEKEDIHVLPGSENFDLGTPEKNKAFDFEVSFEILPDVDLNLSKITIEKPTVEISDHEVNDAIDKLRLYHRTWSDVSRAAKKEDRVRLEYILEADQDESSVAQFPKEVILGEGTHEVDYAKYIQGKMVGDTILLKGKTVTATVKLLAIEEGKKPELDDAFAKQLNITDGKIDNFKNEVLQPLELESTRLVATWLKQNSWDPVMKAYKTVPLSPSMYARIIKQMLRELPEDEQATIAALPMDDKHPKVQRARKITLKQMLLLILQKKYKIEPSEDLVEKKLQEMVGQFQQSAEILAWLRKDEQQMNMIRAEVLEEQVIELLLEKAKVKAVKMSFAKIKDAIKQGGEA